MVSVKPDKRRQVEVARSHMIVFRAILHDTKRYPEPEKFKPERFLNDDGSLNDDEVLPAFGYGRR